MVSGIFWWGATSAGFLSWRAGFCFRAGLVFPYQGHVWVSGRLMDCASMARLFCWFWIDEDGKVDCTKCQSLEELTPFPTLVLLPVLFLVLAFRRCVSWWFYRRYVDNVHISRTGLRVVVITYVGSCVYDVGQGKVCWCRVFFAKAC